MAEVDAERQCFKPPLRQDVERQLYQHACLVHVRLSFRKVEQHCSSRSLRIVELVRRDKTSAQLGQEIPPRGRRLGGKCFEQRWNVICLANSVMKRTEARRVHG